MNQAFLKVLVSEAIRIVTFPFRLLPIRNKQILFTGLTGDNNYDYSCNPKYLYEYMRENAPKDYKYIWAVSDKEKYSFLESEGVKLVKHFTISSLPLLLTSKIIVTNGSYAPWFPFRKKQYVINTWHGGGAYKKVENEKPDANWATKIRARFCAENINLFVASCKVQEDNMIRRTYLYDGDVLCAGTPRNDILVKQDVEEAAKKVRGFYGISEDTKIILYAPTYRNLASEILMDAEWLLQQLNQSGKWVFLCRFHRYDQKGASLNVKGESVIDVCEYPDMQELLCAADILVTDYSSCIWDFAFLYRPCFLYVPDKEKYVAETGFYVDIDRWPYKQSVTMEELYKCIMNEDMDDLKLRIKKHLDELGSYENGNCCSELTKRIMDVCGAKKE